MIVPSKPFPYFGTNYSTSSYFDLTNLGFYSSGREALLSGLISLGLQKGDSVIVPAFMCSSAIEPLKSFGFNLIFVDVDGNLNLSIDNVRKVIKTNDSISALISVQYFGMTKDISELIAVCRNHEIKVIEDVSHSFMSQFLRDKASIKSDIEIFSMRKSLPILDGGALRLNKVSNPFFKRNNDLCVSRTSEIKFLIFRIFEKILIKIGVNIYGNFINTFKNKLQSTKSNEVINLNIKAGQPSQQFKKYLANEEYIKKSQQKIITNFNQLSISLKKIGLRVFLESVGDKVIPQACVVYDDYGGLVDYLRSVGVGAWQWPDIEMPKEIYDNPEAYPNTINLDKCLVLLPIHQDISENNCQYMIKKIEKWILLQTKD
jgi:hypothetical protein